MKNTYSNWDLSKGYRIYNNLHTNKFSIQAYCTDRNESGKIYGWVVYAHAAAVVAKDCMCKVSESGRQRVIETNSKNVHAKVHCKDIKIIDDVEGSALYYEMLSSLPNTSTYDPYKKPYFFDVNNGNKIDAFSVALFTRGHIKYIDPFVG